MSHKPRGTVVRKTVSTDQFARWFRSLDAERQAKVTAAVSRIVGRGPTLGRPHVDVIHGSRLHKLKEARIDRGTRILFAFDSNQNAVMLLGGDKTGKWNRWYPSKVRHAERLHAEHEQSIGKAQQWLNRAGAARTTDPKAL
jgi:hypothetical protein